jgi:hypothetical protein
MSTTKLALNIGFSKEPFVIGCRLDGFEHVAHLRAQAGGRYAAIAVIRRFELIWPLSPDAVGSH